MVFVCEIVRVVIFPTVREGDKLLLLAVGVDTNSRLRDRLVLEWERDKELLVGVAGRGKLREMEVMERDFEVVSSAVIVVEELGLLVIQLDLVTFIRDLLGVMLLELVALRISRLPVHT